LHRCSRPRSNTWRPCKCSSGKRVPSARSSDCRKSGGDPRSLAQSRDLLKEMCWHASGWSPRNCSKRRSVYEGRPSSGRLWDRRVGGVVAHVHERRRADCQAGKQRREFSRSRVSIPTKRVAPCATG
jgi:hypothetical protein